MKIGNRSDLTEKLLIRMLRITTNKTNMIKSYNRISVDVVQVTFTHIWDPRGFEDLGRRAMYFQGAGEH